VLGLVGGIAGAAVGGYIRAAENEHFHAQTSDEIITRAEAEVDLIASSDALREAAATLTDTVLNGEDTQIWERKIRKARNLFVDLAHSEIETGT
jgi:hypothetical protein